MKKQWMFLWMLMVILGQARVSDAQIANMFVLGFEGTTLTRTSPIVRDVCEKGLGGVILFAKNVSSPSQLKALTAQLSQCRHKPLIAVDQEGGKVRRIRFGQAYPRASQAGRMGTAKAKKIYNVMAKELHDLGINYNLAPVADLAIEPKNYIIKKLGRSFGKDPKRVIQYNNVFINAMHRHRILTSLKHFPGHGSSLGDTHRGFVDVSRQHQPEELEPFGNRYADSIMVAHVVCEPITEPGRPASLSPKAISILRRHNPQTVAITDDLQMGAIRKQFGSLSDIVRLAITAGDDLLLFGNQLTQKNKVTTRQLINIVRRLIQAGEIKEQAIRRANQHIARMRRHIRLGTALPSPTHSIPHHKPKRRTSLKSAFSPDMF